MTKTPSVRVELFFAAGCSKCAEAREQLRRAAQSSGRVEWNEVDIAKHPNRAVDVGVVTTPAVAINGRLVFPSMPTPSQLQQAIQAHATRNG